MADQRNPRRLAAAGAANGFDRRQFARLIGVGAGFGALSTLLPAVPSALAQGTAPGQVNMEWGKPNTLGPLFSTAGSEQQVERAIFGALITISNTLVPTLDLAESVDVSPDNTVYTFTLREGVTFNDGAPLTSADVVFTFERALDLRVGSVWNGRLQGIQGAAEYGDQRADTVAGLEAPDERTIRITMTGPDSAFMPILADFSGLGILPKHVLGDVPPEQLVDHPFNLAPTVGAGPFSFVRYEADQFVELERNPAFWGEAPAVEKIFLRIVQPDIAVAELERGSIDIVAVSFDDLERLSGNPDLTVVSIESPSMDSISLNHAREYLQDKRLRQAMMYAIDRQSIADQIYKGMAVVRNSPIFGPDWMGVPKGLNEYAYNPDMARQLVADTGWDTNRTIELMFNPSGNATFANMVPILQAQLADVGIRVELLQLDSAGINEKLIQTEDYEMYIGGGGVYGADPNVSSRYYSSIGYTGKSRGRYTNPRFDELYREGREAADEAARKTVYTELAVLLNDELPSIFLWSPNTNFAITKRLQGFLPPSYVGNRLYSAPGWSTNP